MGDVGDDYRAWNEYKKGRHLSNKEQSTAILDRHHIDYTSHNNGIHLRVAAADGTVIDFWPSTGKFIGPAGSGRGVFNLLRRYFPEVKL